MNKVIAVPIYDRPHRLQACLDSIRANNLQEWEVVAVLDPSDQLRAQMTILTDFDSLIPGYLRVVENYRRLGCNLNTYAAVKEAFVHRRADLVLYVEEDVIISPDATNLAEFYYEHHADTMCCCLFGGSGEVLQQNPKYAKFLVHHNLFTPWGVIITKDQWEEFFKDHWMDEPTEKGPSHSWDFSFRHLAQKLKKSILVPMYPRGIHVGDDISTHYRPGMHPELADLTILESYYGDYEVQDSAGVVIAETLES